MRQILSAGVDKRRPYKVRGRPRATPLQSPRAPTSDAPATKPTSAHERRSYKASPSPDHSSHREYSRFGGTVPADGFYARHVEGLTLRNVTLTLTNPDVRPAIVFVDVSEARLAETPPPVVQP